MFINCHKDTTRTGDVGMEEAVYAWAHVVQGNLHLSFKFAVNQNLLLKK